MRPEPLINFLKDNNYSLVYPAVEKMEPGEIRTWDKKQGLSPNVVAFKDQCFNTLGTRPNNISFGTRTVKKSGGIEFLLGLNQALVPYEAELKGQFERDVEIEIDGGVMPIQEVSEMDLKNCISGLSPECMSNIKNENNVIISRVVQSQKFTFKFKGLKKGGLDIILAKLLNAGFKRSTEYEDAVELNTPMIIAYTGYKYKKGELVSQLYKYAYKYAEEGIPQPKLEAIELDDITMRIAGP